MDREWHADLDSTSWDGRDLRFKAITEAGENDYVIRCHHLRGVAQRTSTEALSLNLPLLRHALTKLARGARPGQTLTLN